LADADEALRDEYTDHQMHRLERELLTSASVRIGSPSGAQSTMAATHSPVARSR
jgi:hypothetical protein